MPKEDAEIAELAKKWTQNPDSMVFVQLADAYRRAGNLERSVEVCLRGLEKHPTYTTARVILGRNYLDLGRLDDAAAEFSRVEVADSENSLAHRMLGQIALQKKDFAEAISRQQKVLALDPDDGAAQALLKQALQAKQGESPAPVAPRTPVEDERFQALRVADIYIKKRLLDKAAEVVQEILAADPGHEAAQRKAKEILAFRGVIASGKEAEAKSNAEEDAKLKSAEEAKRKAEEEVRRKAEAETKRKAEEEAKRKAEEEAKRKAEEEAKRKAEEEAKRKAEEEAKRKAEEEAKRKAEEEAKRKAGEDAKRKAEEEAKRKAEEDAKRKAGEDAKRKAEEDAKRKAEEDAKRKAEEDAKRKAEEDARRKTEEDAKRKAEEDARRKAAQEAELRGRVGKKPASNDILSVIAASAEDLIENESASIGEPKRSDPGTEARRMIQDFLKTQTVEASLLLDAKGAVLESRVEGDLVLLGQTAYAVFQGAERAARNVGFGGLRQILVAGGDGRQILLLALKAGILVAVTGKDTNVGLLRVAVNDLMKRA